MSFERHRVTPTGHVAPSTRLLPRLAPLALGITLALGFAGAARAQSLYELFEDARKFDAPYLAARALSDPSTYKAEL